MITISGGTISGVDYGVWVNSYEGYLSPGGVAHFTVSGVGIDASQVGIYVEDSPQNTAHPAVSATISGDTQITTGGSGTGILVSGPMASATITGNDASIYGNLIGIDVNDGSAIINGNHIYDNGTGIKFEHGGSGSVGGNNFVGPASNDNGTDLYIGNLGVGIGADNAARRRIS